MIADKDRSGWFGASDTCYICGNWTTNTFAKWWLTKEGISSNNIETRAMLAGTHYEHRILDYIGVKERDKQILIPELRLRVNLDGNDETTDYEIKTYKLDNGFTVPKKYVQQVNVQMYASGLKGKIVAYGLTEENYKNYLLPIEKDRLSYHDVEYDNTFISEWLSKIKYLAHCLDRHVFPTKEGYDDYSKTNL